MSDVRFHLTPEGPRQCKATVRYCPLGGDHFDDVAEAQSVWESRQPSIPSHGRAKDRRFTPRFMKNESYVGVDVPFDTVSMSSQEATETFGSLFERFKKNKEDRDGEGRFHATVLEPREVRSLRRAGRLPSSLPPIDLTVEGLGAVVNESSVAVYAVCTSVEGDRLRSSLGLPKKDFHVTLGFDDGGDVHGVSKGVSTLVSRAPAGSTVGMFRQFQSNDRWGLPDHVKLKLARTLSERDYTVMTVVPIGSVMYGTRLPGPVHDYDFVVFADPYKTRKGRPTVIQDGELDVSVYSVDTIQDYARISTVLFEAFNGFRAGGVLYREETPWSRYLHSLRLPEDSYIRLLDKMVRSTSHSFSEPVSKEKNPVEFKNFKHYVRWKLYTERWGTGRSLNPELTPDEKVRFHDMIKRGRSDGA